MEVAMVIRMGHDPIEDWERVVSYVVEGERMGAGTVWSAEAWVHDCVSPLGYLAAKTSRIRLGTGIMQAGTRSPALVAMTALTLSQISNGRFILGLGTSGPQVIEGWHGIPFQPSLSRLREIIEIVRLVTSGERLEYQGKSYRLPLPGGQGKALRSPLPPSRIPIYLGSMGPKSLELIGELADGWICPQFIPERKDVYLKHLATGAKRAGRSLGEIDIHVNVIMEITDEVEKAVARHKPHYAFYIGAMGSEKTNFYAEAYRRAGFEDAVERVQSLWRQRRREEAAAAVPDELVLRQNLIGTERMVRGRIRAFRDAGVNALRLAPEGGTPASSYDLDRLGWLVSLVKEVSAETSQPSKA